MKAELGGIGLTLAAGELLRLADDAKPVSKLTRTPTEDRSVRSSGQWGPAIEALLSTNGLSSRGGIMPATYRSTESMPPDTTEEQMQNEKSLRLKANAIACEYKGSEADGWTLTTTWNVIGEQ